METVTEFVIDLSGSMKEKIVFTKQMLLSDIIPNLDYSFRIGIKSFSAVKNMPPIIQELPLSIVDKEAIIKAVNSMKAKEGGTPISEAIRQSVATLKEYSASNKKIILVTDGEEDKDGNYVAECKKAQADGINCEIHVIGIGLTLQAQAKAQEIAKITNGTYSNIPFSQGTQYSQSTIRTNLSAFYTATTVPLQLLQLPILDSKPVIQVQPVIQQTPVKTDKTQTIAPVIDVNNQTNDLLQTLIQEIKEIRAELKKLKTDNTEVPEIVEDAELNEKIRLTSEKYLFDVLKSKYPNRVKWLNENGESNADHDFEILEEDGSIEYFIECKGTAKQKTTFYITKSEWKLFLNNTKNYQVYFVQNVFSSPAPIFIGNLLDWLLRGKILPYLKSREIIKEERVFLTIADSHFVK